ncbi:MAG: TolC family protein [Oceanospirillaceae bacterium]|nr:TolC family protein [Oceanospirillaceae bacterium]
MKHLRLTMIAASIALAGCSVSPQQLSMQEMRDINSADRAASVELAEPVVGVLTIEEAIARALKYNLDQRVKMLEQSLKSGELEAGKYDMLPKLLANAGYDWRDSFSHRYTAPFATPGAVDKTGMPDVSVDPEHGTWDLQLSWNILDFGASYYTAKQNADKLLIANEKRRRAMHTLVQNVRKAYWRAVAAESLSTRVADTIKDAERALAQSEQLASERVSSPDESLRYQRNLLENLRLMESVQRELASARIELSQLMGMLPGTKFELVEPKAELATINASVEEMEARALIQNADLREQFFNARIAVEDTRKAILKLLPGISFDYGTYYDTDRYLVNDNWRAAGVSVSYNLFNLLSANSRMEAADKNEALANARRMALQMSVLTQVHLSIHNYNDAMRQFQRADQIFNVDKQLEEIVRGRFAGNMASEQTKISANVTTILSELRRYQAMSKFQEATGQLQASMGMEPAIGSIDEITLGDLTEQVGAWMQGGFTAETVALPEETKEGA